MEPSAEPAVPEELLLASMSELPRMEEHLELGAELGRGAFGVVHRARSRRGEELAVKLQVQSLHPEQRARVLREAALLRGLRHPRLTAFRGIFQDARGCLALAYELVPGEPLDRRLERERPGLATIRSWLADLGAALDALHGAGLVHRDLKPANVMCEPDGHLRLLDFGLARLEGPGGTLTQDGTLVGTPLYLSPEVLRGERAGPRADLYALACLAYEFHAGRPPFPGETTEVIRHHLATPPPRLSRSAPGIPEDMDAVLTRALAKQPRERYPSAKALVEALAGASSATSPLSRRAPAELVPPGSPPPGPHSPSPAGRPPPSAPAPAPTPAPTPGRSRWPLAVAALLLLAALLLPGRAPEPPSAQVEVVPGGAWIEVSPRRSSRALALRVDDEVRDVFPGERRFMAWSDPGAIHHSMELVGGRLELSGSLPEESATGEPAPPAPGPLTLQAAPAPRFPGTTWFLEEGHLGLAFPRDQRAPDLVEVQLMARSDWDPASWILEQDPPGSGVFRLPTDSIPTYPWFPSPDEEGPREVARLPPDLRARALYGPRDLERERRAPGVELPGLLEGRARGRDREDPFQPALRSPCKIRRTTRTGRIKGWSYQEFTGEPLPLPDGRLLVVDDLGYLVVYRRAPLTLESVTAPGPKEAHGRRRVVLFPGEDGGVRMIFSSTRGTPVRRTLEELLGSPRLQVLPPGESCSLAVSSFSPPEFGDFERWQHTSGPFPLEGTDLFGAPLDREARFHWIAPEGPDRVLDLPAPERDPVPLDFPPLALDGCQVVGYTQAPPDELSREDRLFDRPTWFYGLDLAVPEIRWQLRLPHRPQSPPAAFRGGMALVHEGRLVHWPREVLRRGPTLANATTLHDFGDKSYNLSNPTFTAWMADGPRGLDVFTWPGIRSLRDVIRDALAHPEAPNPHPRWTRFRPEEGSLTVEREVVLELVHTGNHQMSTELGNHTGIFRLQEAAGGELLFLCVFADSDTRSINLCLDREAMAVLSYQHLETSMSPLRYPLHGPVLVPAREGPEQGGFHLYTADAVDGLYEWWAPVGTGPDRANLPTGPGAAGP